MKKRSVSDIRVGDWIDHERETVRHKIKLLRWSPSGPKSFGFTVCGKGVYTVSCMVDNRRVSDKIKCKKCKAIVKGRA